MIYYCVIFFHLTELLHFFNKKLPQIIKRKPLRFFKMYYFVTFVSFANFTILSLKNKTKFFTTLTAQKCLNFLCCYLNVSNYCNVMFCQYRNISLSKYGLFFIMNQTLCLLPKRKLFLTNFSLQLIKYIVPFKTFLKVFSLFLIVPRLKLNAK